MIPVNNSSIRVANNQSTEPVVKPGMVTALSTSAGWRGKPGIYTEGELWLWCGPLKSLVKESLPQSARTWLNNICVRSRVWLNFKPAKTLLNGVLLSLWILKSEEPLSNDTCVSRKTVDAFHRDCFWPASWAIREPWTLWEFFTKAHHWKRAYQPFIVKQVPSVVSSIKAHNRKTSVVCVVYIIGPKLKETSQEWQNETNTRKRIKRFIRMQVNVMGIKRKYLHNSWGGPLYAIVRIVKHDKGVNSVSNNDRLKRVYLEWRDKHSLTK